MTLLGALVCTLAISSGGESSGGQVELLHFESQSCAACRTMDATVERLSKAGHAIRHIDASEDVDTAQKYQVRRVPCFVVLVDGQERDRHEGTASFDRLNSMIVQARRASVANDAADEPSGEQFVSTTASQRATKPSAAAVRQSALNSTVRIRLEDRPGIVSYGTGTIIDVRDDHALVITCGHLFRDFGNNGRVTVDAIVDGAKRTVDAKLLDYDLEYEIGLLVMSPGGVVESVRVANTDGQPEPAQPLFSVGCNGGADPTIMETKVTAIDRFTGAPNLECTGSPVQGRSGGGLFNEAGQLVAICFGALGGEQRGAYSGLPTVHWLLKKHNLSDVYEGTASSAAGATLVADGGAVVVEDRPEVEAPKPKKPVASRPKSRSAGELVAAQDNGSFTSPDDRTKPPVKPRREESASEEVAESAPPKKASAPKTQAPAAGRSRLGEVLDEQLAKMDPSAEEAQVICIVKPKGKPSAKPKVLVLENPSNEFLTRLAQERQAQELFSSLPARKPAPTQVAKSNRAGGTKIAMRQDSDEGGAQ
jgi:thiol-disulfide isomerase/thioredoxin